MKKIIWIVAIVILVVVCFGIYKLNSDKKIVAPEKISIQNVNIKVGETVKSPLEISGEALGTWYFEASFPVKIYDANGKLLGSVPAQAQSDWETENFVPFKALLYFATSTTDSGTLVLEKDNPSGLPQNAGQYEIPVRFKN
jgi:hypothetical protein